MSEQTLPPINANKPQPVKRGAQAAVNGRRYEILIAKKCSAYKSPYLSIPFNTQKEDELGGCGSGVDIRLNWKSEGDISVEAKRPTPDWMQMKLNNTEAGWLGSEKAVIPEKSRLLFNKILSGLQLFSGKIPPFLLRNMTHEEWSAIKKADTTFHDDYKTCPSDTISNLYREKGCQYIQISGKGLYHTGDDVCGFGVPKFECEQQIRIRIKVHSRNIGGHTKLSVMAAAQPVDFSKIVASPYSLDGLKLTKVKGSVGEAKIWDLPTELVAF